MYMLYIYIFCCRLGTSRNKETDKFQKCRNRRRGMRILYIYIYKLAINSSPAPWQLGWDIVYISSSNHLVRTKTQQRGQVTAMIHDTT